jgi:cytochrome oxidase assembly protein ShyY1
MKNKREMADKKDFLMNMSKKQFVSILILVAVLIVILLGVNALENWQIERKAEKINREFENATEVEKREIFFEQREAVQKELRKLWEDFN